MEQARIKELKKISADIKLGALEAVYSANSGHPGGSLSISDILAYLYFEEMNIDPGNPKKADRDRFVLSKGHTAPALYAALVATSFAAWCPVVMDYAMARIVPLSRRLKRRGLPESGKLNKFLPSFRGKELPDSAS